MPRYEPLLTIAYEGGTADEGIMLMDDMLVSLNGWNRYIMLASKMEVYGSFSLFLNNDERPITLAVREYRRDSVILDVAIAIAAGIVSNRIDKHLPPLLPLIRKLFALLFKKHLQQKTDFRTIMEAAEALAQLAREYELQTPDNPADSIPVVQEIDQSLKAATEPIEKNISEIHIIQPDERIVIDGITKRRLHSGFSYSSQDERMFASTIQLTELNIETGHCRVRVLSSDNPLFHGQVPSCYIEDEGLEQPRNPYTEAFNDQSGLPVYVRPIYNPSTGMPYQWRITHIRKTNYPLFGGLGNRKLALDEGVDDERPQRGPGS